MPKVPGQRDSVYYPNASPSAETIPLLTVALHLDSNSVDSGSVLNMMNGSGPGPGHNKPPATGKGGNMSDTRAKTILIEAVDAVVNSFAKHTYGYGRGKQAFLVHVGC